MSEFLGIEPSTRERLMDLGFIDPEDRFSRATRSETNWRAECEIIEFTSGKRLVTVLD